MAAGIMVLLTGAVIARNGTVPRWERATFHAVNDLPEALFPVLWSVQQLGSLLAAPVVVAVCLFLRRYWLAFAAVLAMVGKLVSERIVKAFIDRQRPGT